MKQTDSTAHHGNMIIKATKMAAWPKAAIMASLMLSKYHSIFLNRSQYVFVDDNPSKSPSKTSKASTRRNSRLTGKSGRSTKQSSRNTSSYSTSTYNKSGASTAKAQNMQTLKTRAKIFPKEEELGI